SAPSRNFSIDTRTTDGQCNNWPHSRSRESRGEIRSFLGLLNSPGVLAQSRVLVAPARSTTSCTQPPASALHVPCKCRPLVKPMADDNLGAQPGHLDALLGIRRRDLNSPPKAASQNRPCTRRLDHERPKFCSHSFHSSVPALTFLPLPLCFPFSSFFLPRLLSRTSSIAITIAPPIPYLRPHLVLRPVPASCPARIPCLKPLSFTSGSYSPPPPRPYPGLISISLPHLYPSPPRCIPSRPRVPRCLPPSLPLPRPPTRSTTPPALPLPHIRPALACLVPAATCLPVPAAPSSRTPLSRAVPRSLEPYPAPSSRTPVPPPSYPVALVPAFPPVPASLPLLRAVPRSRRPLSATLPAALVPAFPRSCFSAHCTPGPRSSPIPALPPP
ncbi:hypothetical protein DFH09DRAFT_1386873, partial [Mycena vulgaris]